MTYHAPSSPRRFACRLLAAALFSVLAVAAGAAGQGEAASQSYPAAVGRLLVDAKEPIPLRFSDAPGGPLFHLGTLTEALGVDLVVGPLGESHRLRIGEREILVGPDQAVMVAELEGARRTREEVAFFSQPPILLGDGLRVPLDFLRQAIGDPLGLEMSWDADASLLRAGQRQSRTLSAEIDLVHQNVTTIEIRFSEVPRYRVERVGNALEVRLQGDRLTASAPSAARSPFVRRVVVEPESVRIELAETAGAAEPRLMGERLFIEVFRQTAAPPADGPIQRPAQTQPVSGVRTIVLDPGHGGIETGAIGPGGTAEKDLTLMIARALKREIERRLPIKVVLTRTEDEDLPHEARTAVANRNQADLFISLHFNSTYRGRAQGAETYFLSREASDQLAAEVAAAENAMGAADSGPESDLQLILWDLAQSYHLAESQRFATLVQQELNQELGLRDRGVKQAPFRVLMGASMPAVLVELGFLNHPEEEVRLRSPIYRSQLVSALVRAVSRFKTQMEARESPTAAGTTGGTP